MLKGVRSAIVLFTSNKISVSKVKNKTKIDILISQESEKKIRRKTKKSERVEVEGKKKEWRMEEKEWSELTLDAKRTESHQPILTVVNRTLKCSFTVDDILLNYKPKILMKSINLYKRTEWAVE